MINVTINGERRTLPVGTTVKDLSQDMQLPQHGVAIAKGGQIVKRSDWDTTVLFDGDELMIVNAAYGG